jgi:hypothetical protein
VQNHDLLVSQQPKGNHDFLPARARRRSGPICGYPGILDAAHRGVQTAPASPQDSCASWRPAGADASSRLCRALSRAFRYIPPTPGRALGQAQRGVEALAAPEAADLRALGALGPAWQIFARPHSLQLLLMRWCWQMLRPGSLYSIIEYEYRISSSCSSSLAPPQFLHLLLMRLCSQMPAPPQSLHWLHFLRPLGFVMQALGGRPPAAAAAGGGGGGGGQMLAPPHSLHLLFLRWCGHRPPLRVAPLLPAFTFWCLLRSQRCSARYASSMHYSAARSNGVQSCCWSAKSP